MKTKLTIVLSLIAFVVSAAYVVPNWKRPAVQLGWDYTTGDPISGFKLYWGVEPRAYTNYVVVGATWRSFTITNLVNGTTYFYTATAFGADGTESEYSNEVTNTTPTKWSPPGKLTATNIQL